MPPSASLRPSLTTTIPMLPWAVFCHAPRDQALRIDQLLPGAQFAAVEPKPHGSELHDPVDDGEQPSRLQVEGDEFDFG